MKLPPELASLLLGDLEPGEVYRRATAWIATAGLATDYELTEAVVYATEVRYAIDVLRHGRPERIWNFGDLDGRGTPALWRALDPLAPRRVVFVGGGPYPVTALLLAERYPRARVTTVDNNLVAHLLSAAVYDRLGLALEARFAEALDVDYAPYDVAVVAAMVSGKRALVERILATSQARVVVRGALGLVHERVVELEAAFRDDGALA